MIADSKRLLTAELHVARENIDRLLTVTVGELVAEFIARHLLPNAVLVLDVSRADLVDVDLAEVEEILYEEYEDEDDDFDCDCDFDCEGCEGCDDEYDDAFEYEVECPECGEVFCFDESVFEDDEPLTCPNCGMVIDEIEIEDEDEE